MKIIGVILILGGILGLAYGGFSITTHKRAVDVGPLQIQRTKRHKIFIPPLLGASGILVGGALLLVGRER